MYNKIIIAGNLSKDIEIRYTQGGSAIANTAMATTRKFKSAAGEQKEEVLFVDITFFGRTAEVANQYLRKGSKVLIDGRLKLDQWTDKQNNKRSKHSVIVESLQMLDSKNSQEQKNRATQRATRPHQDNAPDYHPVAGQQEAMQPHQAPSFPQMDDSDEIPF